MACFRSFCLSLSRWPEELEKAELHALREEDLISPDLIFRDPYFLDFLGLKGAFLEKELEAAILRDIEGFIMDLGLAFTFVARQKRIIVDGEEFNEEQVELLALDQSGIHCMVETTQL